MIIDLICTIILGIVEGITEWLPISSTAHLILTLNGLESFLESDTIFTDDFKLMFDVVIQLGAVIAVSIIYFKKLYPFKYNDKEYSKKAKFNIWGKVIIACVPMVILGLLLDDVVSSYFYNLLTISITLILYGVLFIIVENYCNKKDRKLIEITNLKTTNALAIGFIQVLSIVPGTSRSGVTIIFSRLFGLSKKASTEYSFFLSIPIIYGASLYKLVKYLLVFQISLKEIIILLIGMLVAMVVSLFVIKKLLDFIKKYSFKIFGLYRIILGIIILIIYFS